MKNRVITISREFGSGGRTIGKKAAEKLGIPCYDAEIIQEMTKETGFAPDYVKEAGEWFLRVYIDKEGGVSIDDCEAVSRPLSDLLDEADPIEGSYTFEVSSAGADRVLKKPDHFAQFLGAEVEVKLYRPRDGRKDHVGLLRAFEDGNVTLEVGGSPVDFEKKEIALVRLYPRF